MKKKLYFILFAAMMMFFSFQPSSLTQTKTGKKPFEKEKVIPAMIILGAGKPGELTYDAGTVRFLASSEDTYGAWSLVELKEMPGYKTNLHRHNHTDEAFYILEGELTVNINSQIAQYPAGSYILIPRGTPHAQGNQGKVPVRILLTMTPGGFERSFKDRSELFRTMKSDDPDFSRKRKENAVKYNYDVEYLADWKLPLK